LFHRPVLQHKCDLIANIPLDAHVGDIAVHQDEQLFHIAVFPFHAGLKVGKGVTNIKREFFRYKL